MENYISASILAVGVIISCLLVTQAFKNRNQADKTISVTCLGSKDFVADLIVWNSSFSKKSYELKQAYAELKADLAAIRNYLLQKSLKDEEIVFFI